MKVYMYDIENGKFEKHKVFKCWSSINPFLEFKDSFIKITELNSIDFFAFASLSELTENQYNKIRRIKEVGKWILNK
jgi:hypothetical protein